MKWILMLVLFYAGVPGLLAGSENSEETDSRRIELKAWGVHVGSGLTGPENEAGIRVTREFERLNKNIRLVSPTGLQIPGRSMDLTPLMQIAGDISPEVLYACFRQSSTYIEQKFLYPLDKYLEKECGVDVPDGHLMTTDNYVAELRRSPKYSELFEDRIPHLCWDVIRRECPYGEKCPYVKAWGGKAAKKHSHVWLLPQGNAVKALCYRKDIFADNGLPDRPPDTMDEFLEWARQVHNPKGNVSAVKISIHSLAHHTLSFFYSCGARAVEKDSTGRWVCAFNSPEAVDAYYFVARLFFEPFKNKYGEFDGLIDVSKDEESGQFAMSFESIDQTAFATRLDPGILNFGPIPKGPTGIRGSEFNARMTGIYAGCENNIPLRDAAWKWMMFCGGNEADMIRTKVYVENGFGKFIQPRLLIKSGYGEFVKTVPPGWDEASRAAIEGGVPEPYGKNCQMVYNYMNQAFDQMRVSSKVRECIVAKDEKGAKKLIKEILDQRVEFANQKMLNVYPEDVKKFRVRVATFSTFVIFTLFVLVVWKVMKTLSKSMHRSEADTARGEWQFGRNKLAYLLLLPAILTIAIWHYWPIMRGIVMAFQNYNIRGFSTWVGFENFAIVLFNSEFWYAMLISLEYTGLYMVFGFFAPIALAILLSEVPRGKILFRTIYYLPAMLSGVIVMFLWKGFYGPHGMINNLINYVVHAVNYLFGTGIADLAISWLDSPKFALFFCLLPAIWAHMGPGCLIYLAALKGVPDDLYEAADIDGANAFQKACHITIPSIKALIAINFIGAAVGHMKSGGEFVLAMTGGGPYAPYGETEVVGLHIFWEAFGYLRFGVATAMAWVLGIMLIGFTVLQLQKLSRMEFKAAGGK